MSKADSVLKKFDEKLIRETIKTDILPKIENKFKNIEIDFQVYDYYMHFYITRLGNRTVDYTVCIENQILEKINDERINYIVYCIKNQILDLWCKQIIKE